MSKLTVRTWDEKSYLTMDDTCFTMYWMKESKTIPLSQVISLEIKDPKSKLRPGMITIRLAGTSSLTDRVAAFVYSTGANSIGFPHGFSYLEEGREMLRRFAEYQRKPTDTEEKQPSVADEIRKFKELLDMGAITQAEYDAKKSELLGL